MNTFLTVGDMRRQKVISDMIKFPEPEVAQMPTNPSIGMLMRKGKCVFYAFIQGQYTEGTLEQLQLVLRDKND